MPAQRLNGMVAASLIFVMILGSLVLWLAVPLAWLWLASHIDASLEASLRAYATVAVGVPTTMLALFWLLRRVDAAHQRITGSAPSKRLAPAWRRSLSEERNLHAPTSALDTILAATAVVALIALVVWFFFFAGSPLPNSPV